MIRLVLSSVLFATPALAQDLVLPALSPRASVMQVIGTVEVTVDYASPGKRDRTVWGDLVPYGETWRTGANAATTLTADGDLTVGGVAVPAGTYSVFTVPGEQTWTVILNTDASASAGSLDPAKDQARFEVTPVGGPDRERLTFLFVDTDEDSASLDLEWAGVRVSIPIVVDTAGTGNDAIDAYVTRSARRLADAGKFRAEHGDVAGGLALIEKSLAVNETWYAAFAKAEVLRMKGDSKGAYAAAKRAKVLGEASESFFFRDRVDAALAEWPKR